MKMNTMMKRVDIQASLICVGLVVFSSVTIFFLSYGITHQDAIHSLKERTQAIYEASSSMLNEKAYMAINSEEDMDTKIYQSYQEKLLEIRKASNVRYLYTAKKNKEGNYIYAIDGLDLQSEDFRNPGELIEKDIIEDIDKAFQGEAILPDDILNTSWGKIFLCYYPIYGEDKTEVIGVLGIEIKADSQYDTYHNLLKMMPLVIGGSCILAFIIFSSCFKYISNPTRKDLYNVDGLTKLKNRSSLEVDIQSIYSKVTKLSIMMIDLDMLKKMNDEFGHDEGDRYICLAASVLNDFEKKGICYRFGGDEFVIVTDITKEQELEELSKRIQISFQEQAKKLKGESDLSIGYATYDERSDKNLMDTLKRADIMMYENKRNKRVKNDES